MTEQPAQASEFLPDEAFDRDLASMRAPSEFLPDEAFDRDVERMQGADDAVEDPWGLGPDAPELSEDDPLVVETEDVWSLGGDEDESVTDDEVVQEVEDAFDEVEEVPEEEQP